MSQKRLYALCGICLLAGIEPAVQGQTVGGMAHGNSSLQTFCDPAAACGTQVSTRPLDCSPLDPPCVIESGTDPIDSGFYAGASFYYLKPYAQNNVAAVITTWPGTPNSLVTQESFNWHFQPAAAFSLGWSSQSGIGIQARYFFFDQSAEPSLLSNSITPQTTTQTTITPPLNNFLPLSTGGTAFGSPGTVLNSGFGVDRLAFTSGLNINAIDIEATYGLKESGWSLIFSGGGRYLSLDQTYQAILVNNGVESRLNEMQRFNSFRNFSGGGLVAAITGNANLGRTGFSLFGSVRSSLVAGTTNERVSYNQVVNDPGGLIPPGIPGSLVLNPQSVRDTDHVISTIELELGLQYTVHLSRTDFFCRAAAVNQTYFDAGNASVSTGNLSLLGVQWSAGLHY